MYKNTNELHAVDWCRSTPSIINRWYANKSCTFSNYNLYIDRLYLPDIDKFRFHNLSISFIIYKLK